jgi:hypothetical protein
MPEHFPTFVSELRMRFMEMSMNKITLFRWYSLVHVPVHEAPRDVSIFQEREWRTQQAESMR